MALSRQNIAFVRVAVKLRENSPRLSSLPAYYLGVLPFLAREEMRYALSLRN
jgi:hypothetical protein